jgi:hypothetical protein
MLCRQRADDPDRFARFVTSFFCLKRDACLTQGLAFILRQTISQSLAFPVLKDEDNSAWLEWRKELMYMQQMIVAGCLGAVEQVVSFLNFTS